MPNPFLDVRQSRTEDRVIVKVSLGNLSDEVDSTFPKCPLKHKRLAFVAL